MGVRMIDLLQLTKESEQHFLKQHAEEASRAMMLAQADGLPPAALAQLDDVIVKIRDESIARIRSGTLLSVLGQEVKHTPD